jgi:threonine dehydrogenase-like Zn-dependent dehydrogenase
LDNLQPAFFVAHRQRIVETVANARQSIIIAPERCRLAQELGAHEVLDAMSTDVVAAIRDLTHGERAHKTRAASSAPEARAAAVRAVTASSSR